MESRYDQISPVPPLTPVVRSIVIISVVVFVIDFVLAAFGIPLPAEGGGWAIQPFDIRPYVGLVPRAVHDHYWLWQFVTYIFMHGQPLHILLNMLILWYFGSEIEMRLGSKGFLTYFLLCGVGGGIINYFVNIGVRPPSTWDGPIIGASGSVYGILVAYAAFFGSRYFLVFFLFPLKAKYFVMIIAFLELFTGVQANPGDNVAHFAHLGGMAVGALYLWLRYFRNSGGGTSKKDAEREKLKRQFTLIVNQDTKKEEEKGPYWN